MPGFGFSEAQEMLRRQVRDFALKELAPASKERAKKDHYPEELLSKLAANGFTSINLPEELGGQKLDWVSIGIITEELSRFDFFAGASVGLSSGLAQILLKFGSEEVKREWLPRLAKGKGLVCLAVSEPDCGSDAAAMKTRAVKEGDYYLLEGEKHPASVGMQAMAAVLFAKTDPTAGARGVSCFFVPLHLPGIKRSRIEHTGWKPFGNTSISLNQVRLPSHYRIGEEGKAFSMLMNEFDSYRVILSLSCLGMAEASMEDAIKYAQRRSAFGKPLSDFEGVSFKIAHHATLMEAGRMLCYCALWLKDQGQKHTRDSSMCKLLCPQIAFHAIHDSLLIHGHPGYCQEAPYEQRMRDSIGFELADGTAEIMKMVIAREIIGPDFLPV